jgi:LysM repeat protein
MAQRYVIQRGDTLGKIAKKFYGEAGRYQQLALYNGLTDPNVVVVGQTIEIPARRELDGPPAPPPLPPVVPLDLTPPNGLEQILATFGNIYDYIAEDGTLDPRWQAEFLTRSALPFAMPLSWDRAKVVSQLQCHVKLRDVFPAVFTAIAQRGLQPQIKTFGGCFNFRTKRTAGKLSTHSWGIAIDLNPETNAQGAPGDMDADVVDVFREFGFKWGGDWSARSKDPMHFQFCTGY